MISLLKFSRCLCYNFFFIFYVRVSVIIKNNTLLWKKGLLNTFGQGCIYNSDPHKITRGWFEKCDLYKRRIGNPDIRKHIFLSKLKRRSSFHSVNQGESINVTYLKVSSRSEMNPTIVSVGNAPTITYRPNIIAKILHNHNLQHSINKVDYPQPMNMFQTFLASIPPNRSEMVNELEIPDIPLTPYIWEPYPVSLSDSSLETVSVAEDARSLSTDSSIALSRAMTGSEFDYDWYSRYKRLDLSDPWEQMRIGWAKFPPEHIATLHSLQSTATDSVETAPDSIPFEPFPSQEFLRKIDRFLEEECCVFGPDDPALLELEEALRSVDLENLYSYSDVIL